MNQQEALQKLIDAGQVPKGTTIEQAKLMAKMRNSGIKEQTTQSPIKNYFQGRLHDLAKSTPVQATLGAGDALRNTLAEVANLAPGINIPEVQSGEGTAYNVGNILGNLGTFVGGGEVLEAAPVVGKIAKALNAVKIPREGKRALEVGAFGKRALGSAGYGALMNPEDRATGALIGGALSGGVDVAPELLNAGKWLGNRITAPFKPEQYAKDVFEKIGGGRNLEENAQALAEDIFNSHKKIENESKKIFKPVFDDLGDKNLYTHFGKPEPIGKMGFRNLANKHPSFLEAQELSKRLDDEIKELSSSKKLTSDEQHQLYQYRKQKEDLERSAQGFSSSNYFQKNSKDVFEKVYTPDLKKAHQKFLKNPTLQNAHDLQSDLGLEAREIRSRKDSGKASQEDIKEMQVIENARESLKQDIYGMLKNAPDKLEAYKKGVQHFFDRIVPYRINPDIAKIASGTIENPRNIPSLFKSPEKHIEQIAEDIGQAGKDKIVFSEIGKIKPRFSAKNLASSIEGLENKYLSSYASPELEEALNQLQNKLANRETIQKLGGGLVGALAAPAGSISKGLGALAGAAISPALLKRTTKQGTKGNTAEAIADALSRTYKPVTAKAIKANVIPSKKRKKLLEMELLSQSGNKFSYEMEE